MTLKFNMTMLRCLQTKFSSCSTVLLSRSLSLDNVCVIHNVMPISTHNVINTFTRSLQWFLCKNEVQSTVQISASLHNVQLDNHGNINGSDTSTFLRERERERG